MRAPTLLVPALLASVALGAWMADVVPTDVQQPGTQPGEASAIDTPDHCAVCHGGYDPAVEPAANWRAGMMAHASRDPLFWAAMAIAEQDFDGSGDLCLRCHTPAGWLEGRSTPTDGSALRATDDTGVACDLCHRMTNPDESEHLGEQYPPFLANDEDTPPEGYRGSGMYVLWNGGEKLGPYAESAAIHAFLPSLFHRSADFCGTCHDVSNPVVGDLAPGNGAQVPLAPGTYSGVPGAPVDGKAAFNNLPFQYGVIERTYSEHRAGALSQTRVSDVPTPGLDYQDLPQELRAGAIQAAYDAAVASGAGGDYADGTPRFFTCQTCHMPPVTGKGCNRPSAPVRSDLPLHGMVGGNAWMPDAIAYMNTAGTLRLGGSMTAEELAGLQTAKQRALDRLALAAGLSVTGDTVRVVNLTGHKLISGYPEGRRMWLRTRWYDGVGTLLREDGAYGPLTVDLDGVPTVVETLLDPDDPRTRVYDAHYGMTQEWAATLIGLSYPGTLPLSFDRVTGAVTHTLGELAALPAGSTLETFHFVLNDVVVHDDRIPPWGMSYDEAERRNILPVPADQYGAPGPGGTYEHWDELALEVPPGATMATIDLLYQTTSWEYVQFLHLANDGSIAFLADEGANLLDAWLATGMSQPVVMASALWRVGGRHVKSAPPPRSGGTVVTGLGAAAPGAAHVPGP